MPEMPKLAKIASIEKDLTIPGNLWQSRVLNLNLVVMGGFHSVQVFGVLLNCP
jgi:hypothetical protein